VKQDLYDTVINLLVDIEATLSCWPVITKSDIDPLLDRCKSISDRLVFEKEANRVIESQLDKLGEASEIVNEWRRIRPDLFEET
jgi:hypothetical protein